MQWISFLLWTRHTPFTGVNIMLLSRGWFLKYHNNNRTFKYGLAATTHQSQTQCLWSRADGEYQINILELLSVKLGFMSLLTSVSNQHIRIMSDISITISYINAMGGCRKKGCNAFTKEIWLWAKK